MTHCWKSGCVSSTWNVVSPVDSLQVCARYDAGCQAAVHIMHSIFKEVNTEAVLLIDAGNAFNSVNGNVSFIKLLLFVLQNQLMFLTAMQDHHDHLFSGDIKFAL